jgi:hypothetical protein
MEIHLQPSFWAVNHTAYTADEEFNEGSAVFLHDYETHILEIEPGEEVLIEDRFQYGNVSSGRVVFRLQVINELGRLETVEESFLLALTPGRYKYELDGSTFTLLE